MKKDTKEAIVKWLRNSPDSDHPFDRERFFDCAYKCAFNDEYMDEDELSKIIEEETEWDAEYRNQFASDKSLIINNINDFVKYLKDVKNINIFQK